ncbi:MAG TPA: N-acetylneuraminate synthase family protein, partial [Gaiellaceae bacterium]|nr:N-acetylneuraminate synthase family protein [Gaiellaceae bacterium]
MAATKVGFRRSFEIAGRQVGDGAPAYVIAEAGANHNRDLDMAKQLIDVAAESGADAVKFQTYTGKDLYSSKTPRFEYLDDERSPQELLDAIALPREWQPELAEHAQGRGIAFFSSPFDREAVDSLVEAGAPALKIASFELVDLPLIAYAAQTGLPVILSTGMATYGEIEDALGAVS